MQIFRRQPFARGIPAKEPGAFSEVPHRGQEIELRKGIDPKNTKNTGTRNHWTTYRANAINIRHMVITVTQARKFFWNGGRIE